MAAPSPFGIKIMYEVSWTSNTRGAGLNRLRDGRKQAAFVYEGGGGSYAELWSSVHSQQSAII
jgi:hypothetical protein